MKTPKRERMMQAFMAQLRTITSDNGYGTDVLGVYDWREAPLAPEDCPAIVCRDTIESLFVAIGLHQHNLRVQMELILMDGVDPQAIRQFAADVVYCLGQNLTLGGLASDITPVEGEDIVIEQRERKVASVKVNVVVEFTTEPWNPYE